MQTLTNWQKLAEIGDQFLILYSQSIASTPAATLFSIGHAAELYLKAAAVYIDPSKSGKNYRHSLPELLKLMHSNGLLISYKINDEIRDSIMLRSPHTIDILSNSNYLEYISNQELYWVAYYLSDLKYLGSEHIRAPELFNILVMTRNPYWIPFFKEIQAFLNWPSVNSFTDYFEWNIAQQRLSLDAISYLTAIRQK